MKRPYFIGLASVLASMVLAVELGAQDLTLTKFKWVDPGDPPDTLPVFKHMEVSKVPEGMERLDGYAYAIVDAVVSSRGKMLSFGIHGTHSRLNQSVIDMSRRKIKPAKRDGLAVNSAVWAAVIFNPKSAPEKGGDVQPRLLRVEPVAVERIIPTTIQLPLTVTVEGKVQNIITPEKMPAGISAALKRVVGTWVFAPGRQNGQPVDMQISVPVLLQQPDKPTGLDQMDHPPVVIHQERPEYPYRQGLRGFIGEVTVDFVVDIEGRVSKAFVVRSNNPAFDEAALTAVLKWRFKPAKRDGTPVNCRMQVPIIFRIKDGGKDAFTVQTAKRFQDTLPQAFRFDTAPRTVNFQPAVYPYEALLANKRGSVQFTFAVDTRGQATLVKVSSSPGDDFTEAVRAMVDVMRFDPALKAGKPTNALLRMDLKFSEWHGDISLSSSAIALVKKLRRNGSQSVATLADLDDAPKPVSQKSPMFPRIMRGKRDMGKAVVEFFIDKHGVAQFPHIISASDPAFGYAACQAVDAWRFTIPMQDGRPTVVRARVPVEFKLE